MNIKIFIIFITVAQVTYACKKNDGSKTSSESANTETSGINQTKVQENESGVSVKKVSIGLLPDIQYEGSGVKAMMIKPDQEAEKAGLMQGDIVIALDGKEIKTLGDYTEYLSEFKVGDVVELTILRGKETLKKQLKFE
jgi:S1-C subfamily serine protease